MNTNIEYSPNQVADRLRNASRQTRRNQVDNLPSRYFRAFMHKYNTNSAFRLLVDIFCLGASLGIAAGAALGVFIIQYLKPWL